MMAKLQYRVEQGDKYVRYRDDAFGVPEIRGGIRVRLVLTLI